jgi:glycosyltransferase involved in cell wall biosynthesis
VSGLKIAFIVDKLPPEYVGGYEERIWSFASGLAANHEVRLYSALPGPARMAGENPRRLPSGPSLAPRRSSSRSLPHSLLFSTGLLQNPLEGWRPDVLVVEAIPYLHLYAMRRWVRSLRCAKVLDVVEAWVEYAPYRGLWARPSRWAVRDLLATGLAWSDRALVAASPTSTSLSRSFGYTSVDIIPVGIHFAEPARTAEERQGDAEYDFVSLGRLVPDKRHLDFVAALGLLRARGWKGRAALIGDGPMAGELRDAARASGVEAQVHFAGRVSSEAKLAILSHSRVFILASEREGQSVATLEALSLGLPVIVAKPKFEEVFGVSDMVADGKDGLYFPVGDIPTLAGCMGRLLEDRALRLRLSEEAVAVARRYDWTIVLQSLEASLMSVVSNA